MASKESLGRVRHLNLISQQLRLRHLRSISVRNIVPKFPVCGDKLIDRLLETYFTLHNVHGFEKAIYTSERIKYSLNPTWASFEPSSWKDNQSTAVNSFVVRVWGGQNDTFQLILEWEVHLPSLHYLGDQVRGSHHGYNTVIFGLVDGYYGAPKVSTSTEGGDSSESVISTRRLAMKVDLDQVAISYKVSSILRIKAVQRAIQQAESSVRGVRKSIENKVESAEKCTSQLSEEEMLKLKVKNLREELLTKGKLLHKEREEEKKALEKLRSREMNLKTKSENLCSNKVGLREHKQAHVDKRESLVKLNAQLNMRRRQLVSELMYIYPITEFPHRGTKELLICGVRLPNCESDEFLAMDEDTLSVALGYTCHLVCMVARFLELPLRYPMNSRGSRSNIMDFTIEKVADKDRKFPLYNKAKERIQFDYGVFLLNKNIAQLRQFCGLGTPNLRNTVPNLKELLDSKFQSSEAIKPAPLTRIERLPLKQRPSNSGDSTDAPPANPKLNDVLLRTMNASTADGKPASAALQLDLEQQYNIPRENQEIQGNEGSVDVSPSGINGDQAKEGTVNSGGILHIPTQGTTHRFLEQQRVKKTHKHSENANKTKIDRTQPKLCRAHTAGKLKSTTLESSDKQLGVKAGQAESANSSFEDLMAIEMKDQLSGAHSFSGQHSHAQSDDRNELLKNADITLEQTCHQELRSSNLVDLGPSIDFDFPENGEIDLR